MSFQKQHELHKRRAARNYATLAVLLAFVLIFTSVSLVKMSRNGAVEAFDHTVRPDLVKEPAN